MAADLRVGWQRDGRRVIISDHVGELIDRIEAGTFTFDFNDQS